MPNYVSWPYPNVRTLLKQILVIGKPRSIWDYVVCILLRVCEDAQNLTYNICVYKHTCIWKRGSTSAFNSNVYMQWLWSNQLKKLNIYSDVFFSFLSLSFFVFCAKMYRKRLFSFRFLFRIECARNIMTCTELQIYFLVLLGCVYVFPSCSFALKCK